MMFAAPISNSWSLGKKSVIQIYDLCIISPLTFQGLETVGGGGGQVGGSPGEKGAEGVREARKKGAGSGIFKAAGSGKIRKNYATLRNISQSKKRKEAGGNKNRAGTGNKGYRKREA